MFKLLLNVTLRGLCSIACGAARVILPQEVNGMWEIPRTEWGIPRTEWGYTGLSGDTQDLVNTVTMVET